MMAMAATLLSLWLAGLVRSAEEGAFSPRPGGTEPGPSPAAPLASDAA